MKYTKKAGAKSTVKFTLKLDAAEWEAAIEKAYTVRDRYTVLTLAHELGITDKIKPILMEKYY